MRNMLAQKISLILIITSVLMVNSYNQTLRILPLGNSITQGWMGESLPQSDRVGYRYELYSLLSQAGYDFNLVGSEQAGWSQFSDYEHGGWPSIRDNEVADIMETGYTADFGYQAPGAYLNYYPADIILLHIGTNDVWGNDLNGAPSVERILDAVDDYETSSGNDVLVLLAKIISHDNTSGSCNSYTPTITYNNSVVSMAQDRIDDDNDKIVIVDMQCGAGIDYYTDMYDGWHPNQDGYNKMGQKWFDVIDGINSKPVIGTIPGQTIDEGETFTQIMLDNYISDSESSDDQMEWHYIQDGSSELIVTIGTDRRATISTPGETWSGTETIKFYAFDGGKYIEKLKKSSDTVEVVFTVNDLPNVPVIDGLSEPLSTDEDVAIQLALTDFEVTDPDNSYPDQHTLFVLSGDHYSFSGTTVTPESDYNGEISVAVQVEDSDENMSEIYYATVTVVPVNDPPEINEPMNLDATAGQLYNDSVEVIDLDAEDNPILSILQKPNWLSFNTSTKIMFGTPAESDIGDNYVTLQVTDGKETTNKQFNIVVSPLVGIEEFENTDIFIYPNPAKDVVTITFSEKIKDCHLFIYNLSGKKVYVSEFQNKKELSLNLEELNVNPGMYIVNILANDSELIHFKLIVKE